MMMRKEIDDGEERWLRREEREEGRRVEGEGKRVEEEERVMKRVYIFIYIYLIIYVFSSSLLVSCSEGGALLGERGKKGGSG